MRREEKIFALILLTPKFWVKLFLWSEMTNDRKVTDPSDHSTDQPWWSTKKLSHLFEVLFLLAACQISDDDDDPDKKRPQCCCGQFLPQNFTSLRDTSNVINVEKKYTSLHSLIFQNSPSIPGFLLFLKIPHNNASLPYYRYSGLSYTLFIRHLYTYGMMWSTHKLFRIKHQYKNYTIINFILILNFKNIGQFCIDWHLNTPAVSDFVSKQEQFIDLER